MGEIADDILNGLMCQECGVWMEDVSEEIINCESDILPLDGIVNNPPGHPRTCEDCKGEPER